MISNVRVAKTACRKQTADPVTVWLKLMGRAHDLTLSMRSLAIDVPVPASAETAVLMGGFCSTHSQSWVNREGPLPYTKHKTSCSPGTKTPQRYTSDEYNEGCWRHSDHMQASSSKELKTESNKSCVVQLHADEVYTSKHDLWLNTVDLYMISVRLHSDSSTDRLQLSVAALEKRSVFRPSDFITHRLCCFHLSVSLSQSHLRSYILLECLSFLFEKWVVFREVI